MQINILNSNGVISVYGENPIPNSYFGGAGKSGKMYPYGGDKFLIILGGDTYEVLWTDLLVNNLMPTDYENAYTLLGQIFSAAPPPVTPLAIGDPYQGGIIFYLDGTGQHGLIRAVDAGLGIGDTNNFYAWADNTSNPNYVLTNAVGTAIGTGQSNTNLILAADPNSQAAKYCADYSINGYDDWYLPSNDEMLAMFTNGQYPPSIGQVPYAWTSTEFDASSAYLCDPIGFPTIVSVGKNLAINVIPIRTF